MAVFHYILIGSFIYTYNTRGRVAEANGLIVVRILSGLGEGTMYAGLTELLAAWVPLKERTTLGSLAYGGSAVM